MIYTIKKGCHYSSIFPKFTCNDHLSGTITFLNDCSYQIERQGDTNKIIGLSDNWHHHKDSIRLGWMYYKNRYQIMTITYSKGKRKITYLCDFEVGKTYNFSIEIHSKHYVVSFDEIVSKIDRYSNWNSLRVVLKPYFGGITKAPKTFKIKIT